MVELRTLGRMELTDAAGREMRAVLAQPKRLVLLAYLAVASRRGYRSRDILRALFWPELDDTHARNALSQACRFLRKHVGEDALVGRGNGEVAIEHSQVQCDAQLFEDAVARGDLDAASRLYEGDFLDGVHVADASVELESWIDAERTRLRRMATQLELRLCDRALLAGDARRAEHHARRATIISPDDDNARRLLADVLARADDHADALRMYEHASRHATANTLRRWRGFRGAAIAIAATVAIGAAWSVEHLSAPPALDGDLVAVAPFDVIGANNHEVREGLLDLISASLDGAGPLRVVPVSRVLKLWPLSSRADSGAAESLARTTRAGLVVLGRVIAIGGDSARVTVSLLDARTGGTRELELRDDIHRVDRMGDSIAVAILRDLGRTRAIGAVRAVAFGSSSPAAMRAFLRGEQFYRRSLADSATANYMRAAEIDPRFALAWRRLGAVRAWRRWETDSLIMLYRRRAASLNVRLPARESLLVVADSLYQAVVLQNRDARWAEHHRRLHATLHRAVALYPDDPEVWSALAVARHYFPLDDVDMARAFTAYDRVLALDSAYVPGYEGPALLSLYFDRPGDAWRYLAARRRHDSTYARSDGARLIERLIDPALSAHGRATAIAGATVQGIADAAFALELWHDSAETNVLLAKALFDRHRADSVADRHSYVETLFARGHPAAALAAADDSLGWMHPVVVVQLGMIGAIPAGLVEARLGRGYAEGRLGVVAVGLPFWAARRDTTAMLRLRLALDRQLYTSATAQGMSPDAFARYRRYLLERTAAYLALARGDSATAMTRLTALANPECAGCTFNALRMDRLTLARLLSALGRDRDALAMLEYTSWFGTGVSAFEVNAAMTKARVAAKLGERSVAVQAYEYVLRSWPQPDPVLMRFTAEARRRVPEYYEGSKRPLSTP